MTLEDIEGTEAGFLFRALRLPIWTGLPPGGLLPKTCGGRGSLSMWSCSGLFRGNTTLGGGLESWLEG